MGHNEHGMHNGVEDVNPQARVLHDRWHAFMDAVQALSKEHFTEEDDLGIVVAVQFGGVEKIEGEPPFFVGTNLFLQSLPDAVAAVYDYAVHLARQAKTTVVPVEDVPEDVRREAAELAKQHGISEEDIVFVSPSEMVDLEPGAVPDVPGDQVDKLIAESEHDGLFGTPEDD